MDKRKPILEIGIIVLLILITAAIMNYPINIRGLEFWLFIIIALFETVLVIFITYIINKNRKKKKKIDKKYLEKANQNKLIIIFSLSIVLVIVLSIIKNILVYIMLRYNT